MSIVTAAEIKRRGMGILDPILEKHGEAIISHRGQSRYVVMTTAGYNRIREAELEVAVREAKADYRAGRVLDQSAKSHLRRLDHEL